jgi:cytochrome d ubiquinol oxidase subunit I
MLSMSMWMALLLGPAQLIAGDLHGLNTLQHQPAKVAAMEGYFETRRNAPLTLIGLPDAEAERVRFNLRIPSLGSLILTHSYSGEVRGLQAWPRDQWPPVAPVFYAFRVMVGIGLLMILTGFTSVWLRLRGRLFRARWFHRWCCIMGPSGLVAILAGWITTEVGRQPWTVYGLLRTADSLSPAVTPLVGGSLAAFVLVYAAVYGAGVYYLIRLLGSAPQEVAKARVRIKRNDRTDSSRENRVVKGSA